MSAMPPEPNAPPDSDLKLQPGLDVLLERFRDRLIEIAQNLHRQLWVDAFIADEIVESIGKSQADAVKVS